METKLTFKERTKAFFRKVGLHLKAKFTIFNLVIAALFALVTLLIYVSSASSKFSDFSNGTMLLWGPLHALFSVVLGVIFAYLFDGFRILMRNQRYARIFTDSLLYVLLAVMSVLWIFPFVWLVTNSLRAESTRPVGYLFPREYSFVNYQALLTNKDMPYLRWFTNTLIVATFTSILSTIVVLLTSYTFSRLRFKSRKGIMKLLMVLGMFPGFMAMIAIYFILKTIGLLPSFSGDEKPVANYLISLILVGTSGAAMGYLVSKGYFDTISKSIDEAAEIDGANKAQIFTHIILPMSKPIVIYTALTSFMGPWGDYIFVATIAKQKTEAWSVALGLYEMLTKERIASYFTLFCAGAVLISIPITALFVFMQRYYVSGVTGGAVKG